MSARGVQPVQAPSKGRAVRCTDCCDFGCPKCRAPGVMGIAPTGEVIELDYERCLVLVRLDADIPPAIEVKQRVTLEPEAPAAGVPPSHGGKNG